MSGGCIYIQDEKLEERGKNESTEQNKSDLPRNRPSDLRQNLRWEEIIDTSKTLAPKGLKSLKV